MRACVEGKKKYCGLRSCQFSVSLFPPLLSFLPPLAISIAFLFLRTDSYVEEDDDDDEEDETNFPPG